MTNTNVKSHDKKRLASLGLALAIGAPLLVGTTAYFTDRVATSASGTAGTVALELAADTLATSMLDADGKDILNPGDQRVINYELTNTGNKSVDVREKIVLTSSVPMDTIADQAEFEIYNAADVKFVDGRGYMPNDGASPLEVRSISDDGLQITYDVPEYVLNGNEDFGDENREIEAGISVDSNSGNYVLVFKGAAGNDFQGATVTIDILAEAKQHRNTDESVWAEIASESVTFGGVDVAVVPEAN